VFNSKGGKDDRTAYQSFDFVRRRRFDLLVDQYSTVTSCTTDCKAGDISCFIICIIIYLLGIMFGGVPVPHPIFIR